MGLEQIALSEEQRAALQAQQFAEFLADFLLGKNIQVVCLKKGGTNISSAMPGDFLSIRVKNGKLTWRMDVPSGHGFSVNEEFSLRRTFDEARKARHDALKAHLEFYVNELPRISPKMLKTIEDAQSEGVNIPSALTMAVKASIEKERHDKIKKAEEAVALARQQLDQAKSRKK